MPVENQLTILNYIDKYRKLSEDAQRLLCYCSYVGTDSNKRMSEHIYLLGRYCFAAFDGDAALKELLKSGYMVEAGKDWYSSTMKYEVHADDAVLAIIYLKEKRHDLCNAFAKTGQQCGPHFELVCTAVDELVESRYTRCDSAQYLTDTHVRYFYPVAAVREMVPLIEKLSPDVFAKYVMDSLQYFVENDMVVDTAVLKRYVTEYRSITEATRCKLIAEVELYEYMATGAVPAGFFDKIASSFSLVGMRYVNKGKYADSLRWFEKALEIQNMNNVHRDYFQNVVVNLYLIMAYMHVDNEASRNKLVRFVANHDMRKRTGAVPSRLLAEVHLNYSTALHQQTLANMYKDAADRSAPVIYKHLAYFFSRYLGYASPEIPEVGEVPNLAILRHEMAAYLPLSDEEKQRLEALYGNTPALTTLYHKAAWEEVLDQLVEMAETNVYVEEASAASRLMYLRTSMDSDVIQVREQSRLKNGLWGSGKIVTENKYRTGMVECMNDADRRILSRFMHSNHWELTLDDVVEELLGTDRLYFGTSAPYEPVKLHEEQPYLIVEKKGNSFVVTSNVPKLEADKELVVVVNSPTDYTVIRVPYESRQYYKALLKHDVFPLNAEAKLREVLPKIGGKVDLISSLIDGGCTLNTVEGSAAVGFQITPRMQHLYSVNIMARPLTGGYHKFELGEGEDTYIDEADGERVRVVRDMEGEECHRELLDRFFATRNLVYAPEGTYDAEFVLDVLTLVREHPDSFFVEWPAGQGIRIRSLSRGTSSWMGAIKHRGGWFDIEGDIEIDEETKLSIVELLELAANSAGKYVKLDDGEYLALSESLRKQLSALDAIVNREKGKVKISPFSIAVLSNDMLNGDIKFMLDGEVVDIRKRILECSDYRPEVPEELNATLRPYQLDGYQWIARLNSWGAGALLADDMGLGKTIQTIAFLLLKAKDGPSLVVAPASVAPNWKTELEKFAPSLNSQVLNFAANRLKMIGDAGAGDVIITTYGILLSIQEAITEKKWNVVCLDEAHIIKNRGAKTSAAAMKIKAANRVMLTGTPVQNHLGELWSLFQFVNPGLLGGYDSFSRKFIGPIENNHNAERHEQLERIVHPFMLRRTKQAVLDELPEKTEIYQPVEMSKEEMAIYETIRIRAEKLLEMKGDEVDINVLAEITRLRQAACSAKLVESAWSGEDSKVTTLVELLQGVVEGGNRALVFSQFVSFFDIVRKELDARNVEYLYIDGSTPVKKRSEMVEQFQKGECPVFLISLKAGGLGLNLTNANYVIHLDPWWNPAIEQQATDRAYRIGQQRAVTVYHLVSKNTIEEKIIRLHESKRDLADNILAGTDASFKLTGKDLLEMVRK